MLTVLLVDDDAEFTDVACTIIEFLGHEVLTASTLAEAREWLSKESFDHILLDFMLPDGSGLHLMESLQPEQNTRVTLITVGHEFVKAGQAVQPFPEKDPALTKLGGDGS